MQCNDQGSFANSSIHPSITTTLHSISVLLPSPHHCRLLVPIPSESPSPPTNWYHRVPSLRTKQHLGRLQPSARKKTSQRRPAKTGLHLDFGRTRSSASTAKDTIFQLDSALSMLSNPPHMSGLHSRQRQHRRQNSTPSAFDPVKIAPLPNLQQRRPMSAHRRGLSLDTRGQQLAPAPSMAAMRHDYMPVNGSATNPGQTTTSRHVMRDAQQQRTARPGLAQAFAPQDRSDSFLVSPQVTPQSRRFTNMLPGQEQMGDIHGLPFDQYSTSLNIFERSASRLSNSIDPPRDFDFFGPDSALSTPSFMTFPDSSPAPTCQGWNSETETASTHSRRSSRRISIGIIDKVAKFEAMGTGFDGPASRPCTPSDQITNGM